MSHTLHHGIIVRPDEYQVGTKEYEFPNHRVMPFELCPSELRPLRVMPPMTSYDVINDVIHEGHNSVEIINIIFQSYAPGA